MKTISAILRKEWNGFLGSERGVFAIYAILIFSWSFIPLGGGLAAGPVWWLFFSVIISGNFATTVFVSERLNGSMEILLTSGFTRGAVFFGKVAFIACMSIGIGMLCFCLAFVWLSISGRPHAALFTEAFSDAGLFCAGTVMNVACGAWLSIRLHSPRIIPFITLLLTAFIVAVFYGLAYAASAPLWSLVIFLSVVSAVCLYFAYKEFNGEKVIQPIDL